MSDITVPNPSSHNQWYPFLDRPTPDEVGGANPAIIPVTNVDPLPSAAKYVVVGAGIHGMSTAYHLAKKLERSGAGKGSDHGADR